MAQPDEQEPVPVDPTTELPVEPPAVDAMLDAPPEGDAPKPPTDFERRVAARVVVEFVELRQGAGPAYASAGRAYQDDRVLVKRRSDDGRWYEVEAGGVRGWVLANQVELVREDVRRGRDGATDAGRDRRQTNYRYDDKGRRLGLDGRPVGSGEGTADGPDPDDFDPDDFGPPSGRKTLRVHVGAGAAQIARDFASNITVDGQGASALTKLKVSSTALSYELGATWAPSPYFAVGGRFRDSRFTDTTIPANADFGFAQPITLAMDAQQVELDATGRYPLGALTVGGYGGLRLLRQAFQQTKPYPLFLTNTYVSAGVGLVVTAAFGPVDFTLQGGVDLPLTVSQDPLGSGDPKALGADGTLEAAYALTDTWAIYVNGHFQQIDTDFTGPGEHVDNVTGPAPRAYEQAKEKDGVLGGGLGVRWAR